MTPVIQLRRIKTIVAEALAVRFPTMEKAPPKQVELRDRPRWRIAGRELDALTGMNAAKFVARARKSAKLRLFRVWKLLGDFKAEPAAAYRPVAERLRVARRMLRL